MDQIRPAAARKIPCVLMRGGTSRGPYFLERDLPADPAARDRVLLAAMGSPHSLQVDGIGGGHALTSKVAIVAPASRPGADVDYLFAQVSVDRAFVDWSPNCGNMLSGVAPFAIEAGLVAAADGETTVRIFNRNTNGLIEATVRTPGGIVAYDGEAAIDGVAGTAAPIRLAFLDAVGSKTAGLFPTGQHAEEIDGVRVTLADYAMPMMLAAAADLGIAGDEAPEVLDRDAALIARIQALRLAAGRRMGLGDVSGLVVPKVGLLSAPRRGGTLTSRYFVPDRCHRSHAVTGGLCVAVAARTPGTVAYDLASPVVGEARRAVAIEHPSGRIDIDLTFAADGRVTRAGVVRTARRIFEGHLLVPAVAFG
ncbi:MAG: 4-oxalomesaconate tautomerase [Rhodovulum sp.]|nr:4-oxalomesaconate tautomerase [Rhodovulum sp.]